jgi:integrase
MHLQEILLENERRRYLLIDDSGTPIYPVAKYLKYLDNTGKSINTIKTYCYALKAFYSFLVITDTEYSQVDFNVLANFVGWLRIPYDSHKILLLLPEKARRSEKSCNLIITVVTNFYDYLYRSEMLNNDVTAKLIKQLSSVHRPKYKDFLFHVTRGKPVNTNVLKLKEPRKKLAVLCRDEVEALYNAATNLRDRFLIKLLFETGMRIGEVLSLFIEDFVCDHRNGHKIVLTHRPELQNGARQKSGVREIYVSQELMNLFDDYLYEIFEEYSADTNFIFIKIRGKLIGQPMQYSDVSALFKTLKKKTGLDVHPHLLRHTHATTYYQSTKDIKQVQERLGHAQIQTTINIYLHPSDKEVRDNWKKAEQSFAVPEAKNEY